MLTLAQPGALQLISSRAHAGKLSRLVDTLILTQVAGVAALVDVWTVTDSLFRLEPGVEMGGKGQTNRSPLQAKPSGPSS